MHYFREKIYQLNVILRYELCISKFKSVKYHKIFITRSTYTNYKRKIDKYL